MSTVGVIYENVPLPPARRTSTPRNSRYPLHQMQVGQCLRIEPSELSKGGINGVRAAVFAYRKTYNKNAKFAVRPFPDNSGAVGVWRLEDAPADVATAESDFE